jgi:hypothetical protein
VLSSLKRATDDFDENGEISVNFSNLYYLTGDEANGLTDVNDALLASDRQTLNTVLSHSDYYFMLISVGVYEEYHKVGDEELFIDLTSFASYNSEAEYYAPNAIYLSSIEASKLPGIANLPDDTLICIRQASVMGGKSKEHLQYLEDAKKILINFLKVDMPDN